MIAPPAPPVLPGPSGTPGTPTERLTAARTSLRRSVLRRRRPLAALLVAVAVLASLRSLAPTPPPSTVLAVAVRDLPAGHTLAPGDLTPVRVPPAAVPAGVLARPDGRLLAGPLRRGEAVTDVRVLGAGLADSLPRGTLAVPVRLSDAGQVALLEVGDAVDVISAGDDGVARVAASCARVLAVPSARLAGDPALPGRLVVLAAAGPEARALGVRAVTEHVTFTWCRR